MWSRLFPSTLAPYVRAVVVGIAITILVLVRDGFHVLMSYVSGLTTAGILLILFGLLLLVIHFGSLDGFAFAFQKAKELRRKDFESMPRQTYWDYLQAKQEQRRLEQWSFMAYVWVGVVFTAAGLIVELWVS